MLRIRQHYLPLEDDNVHTNNHFSYNLTKDSENYNFYSKLTIQNLVLYKAILEESKKDKERNYIRQIAIMFSSILFVSIWISCILFPNINISVVTKKQLYMFIEILALSGCYVFLACGLILVGHIGKKRQHLGMLLTTINPDHVKKLGLQSYLCKSYVEAHSKREKIIKILNNHCNKVDLCGTTFTTSMQTISVINKIMITCGLLFDVCSISISKKFNLQGVVDIIGNILFFSSTLMLLTSNILQNSVNKSKGEYQKSEDKKTTLSLINISMGAALILFGKVLVALEDTKSISYNFLGLDKNISLGLIVRVFGMIIFCIGYGFIIYKNRCDISKTGKEINEIREHIKASSISVNRT
ncbi:hypothetical protein [Candidatus Neoehrlichia procyonis]|uniref:Putative membrane protein n=1 Tax=Candidatus Neoehrlichia procyonis str. RAC413 TaxID=1359163 RepID=A0A0F3NNW0_9RICK|nr:hypothetical protein [Candidatus Neoehrlichia lotoris]KJV69392.1 putative membrane protein [Candidatus Neoehrlichia lotoris str. RAC413]